jgi:hypothetical protein
MRLEILNDITDDSKDDIFKSKLEDAKYEYLRLVYPFDSEINELPNDKAKNWQTKCAIELYRLMGQEGLIQYSENGLTEIKAKSGLSKDLLNELPPPKAGVPK